MNVYDFAYLASSVVSSPYWLLKPSARRKIFSMFRGVPPRDGNAPAVMIHAVSLGEINATRALVDKLRAVLPGLQFIVSSTTETGLARGRELYGDRPDVTLIRYPLDFSGEINRTLDAVRPDVVALMELETWPNFIRQCNNRGIPVLLVNGRMTEASFKRYASLGSWLGASRRMFQRLSGICAQEKVYADRFIALGADPAKVRVTGTMKFDNSPVAGSVPGDLQLAAEVGLEPFNERIWVCGSTGPGEERIILERYRSLLGRFPRLRLAIVPRKPERFDEVAELIREFKFYVVRRSRSARLATGPLPPVILGDTIGELKKFYSIATVVFVGRTLVDLGPRQHGSDMIEPAALAKPVVIGPYTANFAEPMAKFTAAEAMLVASDGEALEQAIGVLLSTPDQADALGRRAQEVVRANQGATVRNGQLIYDTLVERIAPAEETAPEPTADEAVAAALQNASDDTATPFTESDSAPAPPPPKPPVSTLRPIGRSPGDDLPPADQIVPNDRRMIGAAPPPQDDSPHSREFMIDVD
jgi:3-deoxy-D-manno-octulosonic-acid transferase